MHTRTRYAPAAVLAGTTALTASTFVRRNRGTRPFVSAMTVRPRTNAARAVAAVPVFRTTYSTRSRAPAWIWRTGP